MQVPDCRVHANASSPTVFTFKYLPSATCNTSNVGYLQVVWVLANANTLGYNLQVLYLLAMYICKYPVILVNLCKYPSVLANI